MAIEGFFVVSCGTCQRESIVVEPGGACGQLGKPSCPQIHGAVFFAKEDCKMGVGIEALFTSALGLQGSMPFCVELDNLKDTDAPIHQPAAMLVAAD